MPCSINSLRQILSRVNSLYSSVACVLSPRVLLTAFVWLVVFAPSGASAQTPNVQFTNKTVDFGDRGEVKVNPSTLGMEIQIPLSNYPGRAGLNLPVTLSYSSKLWRFEYNFFNPGHYSSSGVPIGDGYTGVVARYAEHSMSGWTTSLGFPFLDGAPTQYYDETGYPSKDANSCPGMTICYTVDRQVIWMPDGSSHEFRSTDQPKSVYDNTPFPDDMYAVDGSRMRYQKSTQTLFMPDGSRYLLGSKQYVDRNGNTLTYDSANSRWLDTLGRAIPLPPVSMPGTNVQPTITPGSYTYSLPGVNGTTVNYTFVWKHLGDAGVLTTSQPLQYTADTDCSWGNANSPRLFASDSGSRTCIANANTVFNPVVLYQIMLPTGRAYTFTYDIYGEIDKVQLPTGGYERYAYGNVGTIDTLASPYRQANRGVTDCFVSASGTGSDEAHWQYAGGGLSPITITAPDNSQTVRYINATVGLGGPTSPWSYDPATNGTAFDERYYSAPDGGGVRHMLRRKLTDWATTGSNGSGITNANVATRNPRMSREVEILLDTGGNALAKSTTYGYDTTYQFNVSVDQTSVIEYDYVSVAQTTAQSGAVSSIPTGSSVLRTTLTSYLTGNSAYRSRNIVGLPTVVTVQNASGGTVAQTTVGYDEYSLISYGQIAGWSDPGTSVRGNMTTTNHWLDTSGTYVPTHAQYDQAGSTVNSWDANGNLTQTAYSSANVYAYPTSVTTPVPDPTGAYGSTSSLVTTTAYDFTTGLVTSTTDANNQTTSLQYVDPLDRLTQVSRPDGGQTTYTHVDTHQCGAYVLTQTLLDSSGRQAQSWQFFDGMGRPYLTETDEHQDANNPYLRTDTQYDSMGRVFKVSNPYRTSGCTATPNPSGWTQTAYDGLSRPTRVWTTTDNAVVTTAYSGNVVTVTDQTGKQRISKSDARGLLTELWEVTPNDTTTYPGIDSGSFTAADGTAYTVYGYRTSYTYDALDNPRMVNQGGQLRYFMYDSLSRLIRAKNPEQAAGSSASNMTDPVTGNTQWSMAYGYDNNGNMTARVDARNVTTTYGFDALNRPATVRYTDGTKDIDRHYDGAINGKGRFWYFNWDANGNNTRFDTHLAVDQYDAMGRTVKYRQHFFTSGVASPQFLVTRVYDYVGHVTSQTYPSGHAVSYSYDIEGRFNGLSGNIGDGVSRTYSTGVSYNELGGVQEEQFGTQTPLYHKLHYNVRGQVYDVRLSTISWASDQWAWNRGALINFYSTADYSADNATRALSGTDNNGNVRRSYHFVPLDDASAYGSSANGAYAYYYEDYNYDSLNRLTSDTETAGTSTGGASTPFSQAYRYDRWGNRTINAGLTWGAPAPQFTADPATNRLSPPAGYTMSYDTAGNLTFDNYTGQGTRAYDAEGRMKQAQDIYQNWSTYTYDADGRRVKRATAYGETWQVYGVEGELLAEYKSGAAPYIPTKEYGYRRGELLVSMTGGDDGRLSRFVTNLYYGALQRDPTSQELQSAVNQLAAAGAQSQSQLQTTAAQIARSLFTQTAYETSPYRSDSQYVADLYNAYLQRSPDSSGWNWWTSQVPGSGRANVCNAFEASGEFQTLVSTLYGAATSDNQRTEQFVNNFYLGAFGRNATATELQQGRDQLNAAATQSQDAVKAQAETFGRGLFAAQVLDLSIPAQQFVTNLYEGFLQRGPDAGGLSFWTSQAGTTAASRQNVLNAFATCPAFRELSGTLYRETFWLVGDHLGTPRMVVDKSGSLAGVKRHDYLPFGEELSAGTGGRATTQGYSATDNVRQKFTSKERDAETNLDFFGARYYSSGQGRFTSVDFAGATLTTPQGFNRYQYCLNNPLRYIDPDGNYNIDVHRYLTELLALAAGFSKEDARAISVADQRVDDDPSTSPMPHRTKHGVSLGIKARHQHHFMTAEQLQKTKEKFEASGSLDDLGTYLHDLQDSHSHKAYLGLYGWLFGQIDPTKGLSESDWEKTDDTWENVAEADAMAWDTYYALVGARDKTKGRKGLIVPWGIISSAVHDFNAASTPEEKLYNLILLEHRIANYQRAHMKKRGRPTGSDGKGRRGRND
jgi:RHS repeat-associated protein